MRRTPDQIRAAIVTPPAKTSVGIPNPMPAYDKKITQQDIDTLVHYLTTLPLAP
jgi:hypothetical protein